MSKEMAVIAIGVWVMLVPYLGITGGMRTMLLILTGLGLVVLGFFLRAEILGRGHHAKASRGRRSFAESLPGHSAGEPHPQDAIDSIKS